MTDSMVISDAQITAWCDRLRKQAGTSANERLVVGIAGIPGAGKSTLSRKFVETMNLTEPGIAVEMPLDGFHFSNAELTASGRIEKKGAPSTFDVESYLNVLEQVAHSPNLFTLPAYDRKTHEPTLANSPHELKQSTRIVVTEGNYLLLNQPPWNEIPRLLDVSFFLECPTETAHSRLVKRHVDGGRDIVSAEEHYQRTDYPNTRLIVDCSSPATFHVAWET